MPYRTDRRCARSSVVSADQNHVGMSLGHARSHGSDADFGHELHRNARAGIRIFQVVNKLRQIFDGIDVVVRRRRDQAHARYGMPHARDEVVDFVAGQLPALTGFRALRDLDLQIVRVDQVIRGDAKTRRRHLFDRAATQIAIGIRFEARFVLAALAGIRLATDAIHGDGQGFVRFFADRPERHRSGSKALDDIRRGLHFLDRHRFSCRLEIKHSAQHLQIAILLVDNSGKFLEGLEFRLPHRVL